jgi:tRNA A37 threonylcarbamoyladenosine biosynthesis protein TsaE
VAYYKKVGVEAPGSTIDTKTRRRMSFREKGDEKNVTTVEWSDEAGEDKSHTFILVNTAK